MAEGPVLYMFAGQFYPIKITSVRIFTSRAALVNYICDLLRRNSELKGRRLNMYEVAGNTRPKMLSVSKRTAIVDTARQMLGLGP